MSAEQDTSKAVERQKAMRYRQTHSRDGYPLGSLDYPDNREGRRRLARTWKRAGRP